MKKIVMSAVLLVAVSSFAAAESRSFQVSVSGHGRPMILIPGLSSPGEVWDDSIAHFSKSYECHRLTLAGFAGQKPIDGPLLPTVRSELAAYIREKKLDRPIIVGHSLGGFLALWLAATEPGLVGPVVSVDGLPGGAALMMGDGVSAEQIATQAEQMRSFVASESSEQFAAQTRMSLASMISGKENLERIAAWAVKSDPSTVGLAMKELLTTDLRGEMAHITAPLLLIGAGGNATEDEVKKISAAYEEQIARVPHHQVVVAKRARHFIMLDDPTFFLSSVDSFLTESAKQSRSGR